MAVSTGRQDVNRLSLVQPFTLHDVTGLLTIFFKYRDECQMCVRFSSFPFYILTEVCWD